jgi:hypothetical protein
MKFSAFEKTGKVERANADKLAFWRKNLLDFIIEGLAIGYIL